MSREIWLWWSGGKDAAWTLERLLDDSRLHVTGLVTTFDPATERVPFQGASPEIVEAQAMAAGLPLHLEAVPFPCSNEIYAEHVRKIVDAAGVDAMAFGDLHLEDVREHRESLLGRLGVEALFPLWGEDSALLADEMLAGGLEARISCVDPSRLPQEELGRDFDADFLGRLAPGVDPCGEGGEYHTLVTAGPMFVEPIEVASTEILERGPCRELGWQVTLAVDGTLDLHPFPPAQIKSLVNDYLDACRARGVLQVRLIHGKGIGVQRETVHAALRRRDDVSNFALAGEGRGGWGATLVELMPPEAGREGET